MSAIRKKLIELVKKNPMADSIEVSLEEYHQVLELPEVLVALSKPRAPVKARTLEATTTPWYMGGITKSKTVEEWDHHAPEYLKALAAWEKESRKPRSPIFMGKRLVIAPEEK